jgi:hypothetical protein
VNAAREAQAALGAAVGGGAVRPRVEELGDERDEVLPAVGPDVVVVAANERRHHRAHAPAAVAERLVGEQRGELHGAGAVIG